MKHLIYIVSIHVKCFCILICVISVISSECFSQKFDFTREFDVIPLSFDGVACQVPWTTGYNYINPRFCDIDGDDDQDLVMGSDWARLSYYRNIGNANNCSLEVVTDLIVSPPPYLPLYLSDQVFLIFAI